MVLAVNSDGLPPGALRYYGFDRPPSGAVAHGDGSKEDERRGAPYGTGLVRKRNAA